MYPQKIEGAITVSRLNCADFVHRLEINSGTLAALLSLFERPEHFNRRICDGAG
jgi:hypothetical protein